MTGLTVAWGVAGMTAMFGRRGGTLIGKVAAMGIMFTFLSRPPYLALNGDAGRGGTYWIVSMLKGSRGNSHV